MIKAFAFYLVTRPSNFIWPFQSFVSVINVKTIIANNFPDSCEVVYEEAQPYNDRKKIFLNEVL